MANAILSPAPSRRLPVEQARTLPATYPLGRFISRSALILLAQALMFARTRRLLPAIVTHRTMDFVGAVMSTLRCASRRHNTISPG